jgi:hypothetical protein
LDLDTPYQERISQLVFEVQTGDNCYSIYISILLCSLLVVSKMTLDESEDKALPRLGATYGVLRRLGFSEERVLECLRSIHGVDLDEAFDWVG